MDAQAATKPHEVFEALLNIYRREQGAPLARRWLILEAAHITGQTRLQPHLQVHWLMLWLAWQTGNRNEIAGQLFRLCLVPLGHLSGRLPMGNGGRSNVSAFKAMPPSAQVLQVIQQARRDH